MSPISTSLAAALMLASASTAADTTTTAMQRCRQITDNVARIACYDAIPLPAAAPAAGTTPAPSVAPATTPAAATTATAAVPSTPAPAPAPMPPAAAPVGATAAASPDPNFGLPVKPVPAANDAVQSTISGLFNGWIADSRLVLTNGQVWQINDGSSAAYSTQRDPKVRITRGLLGSFFMEIDGVSQTPRVKRLK